MMDVDPWLAPLREIPETREWMSRMDSAIAVARASYVEVGGPALLGVG
jgi:hypothetical protein